MGGGTELGHPVREQGPRDCPLEDRMPEPRQEGCGIPAERKLGRTVFTGPENPQFLFREPLHMATPFSMSC